MAPLAGHAVVSILNAAVDRDPRRRKPVPRITAKTMWWPAPESVGGFGDGQASWRRSRNALHGPSAALKSLSNGLPFIPRGVGVLNVVGDAGDSAGNARRLRWRRAAIPFRLAETPSRNGFPRWHRSRPRGVGTRKRRKLRPVGFEKRRTRSSCHRDPLRFSVFFPASSGKTPLMRFCLFQVWGRGIFLQQADARPRPIHFSNFARRKILQTSVEEEAAVQSERPCGANPQSERGVQPCERKKSGPSAGPNFKRRRPTFFERFCRCGAASWPASGASACPRIQRWSDATPERSSANCATSSMER